MAASTIALQRTADFAKMHVANSPLMFQSNTAGDPLYTMADSVRQFIVAPPFAWRWNRSQVSATLVQGQQDFTVSIADFGWLEKGVYIDPTGATFELQAVETLGQEASQSQPTSIAVVDDSEASITFRVFPPPPNGCTVNIVYQKCVGLFQSMADTWAPVPDWMYYLVVQGMKWQVYEYKDDPRAFAAQQIFLRQVIAANAGLSDTQVNIFLSGINGAKTQQTAMQSSAIGRQARGLFG
jgi:hypothetical protein